MRLNWYLPPSRKKGASSAERPGTFRRVLKRLGPTWLASPLRRVVQSVCLLVFLGLFFYVCWPYTARPVNTWSGWLPVEVNAETGAATLAAELPPAVPLHSGAIVHVSDAGAGQFYLGSFRVERAEILELQLVPIQTLGREQLDQMAASFGPWSLGEQAPGSWPSHYADSLRAKERLAAEAFLIIDPLVSLSTAIAARSWVWSLTAAAAILALCLLVPRGFCGYVCPLGTLIDVFDAAIGKRFRRFHVAAGGWWVHLKYFLLAGTLAASLLGVLVSGYVSAIPVVTRFLNFVLSPLQMGLTRSWHQVPPWGAGHWLSLGLFALVLGLGLLRPRFWCRYVCPSGALFSLGNLFRVTERKVEATCIDCDKCVQVCSFDAIQSDFATRTADCTLCQTCGAVCPSQAIKFVARWNGTDLKAADDPPTGDTSIGRRGFLTTAAGVAAGLAGGAALASATRTFGAGLDHPDRWLPVRPPGSVPEQAFLQLCIRCGECFQACPNNVLQPLGFAQGLEGLWTPYVVADWSGCEPSCCNCGQVCPTGAIRALPLEEKRVVRMGLAVLDPHTCLPLAGRESCRLCVDECIAAGYDAIEFLRVGTEIDAFGLPVEDSGFLAPVVVAHKCVGCGLCQTRCYAINHKQKGLLQESAIVVQAGPGREDRLQQGSYLALRAAEAVQREERQRAAQEAAGSTGGYLPSFLESPENERP